MMGRRKVTGTMSDRDNGRRRSERFITAGPPPRAGVGGGGRIRLFRAVLSVKAETLVGPQSVTAVERNRNPSGRVASFRPRSTDFCSAKKKLLFSMLDSKETCNSQ